MSNKQNLLIVLTCNFPSTLKTGGQQAVYHMINNLRKELDITIIYYANLVDQAEEEKLKQFWSDVKFYPFRYGKVSKLKLSYLNVISVTDKIVERIFNKSVERAKYKKLKLEVQYDRGFLELLQKVVIKENIDIVQTEFFDGSFLVNALPDKIKKVFVQHEIRFVRNQQYISKRNDINLLDKYWFENQKMEEIAAMNKYDAVVTLTDEDKEYLKKEGVYTKIFASPAIIENKIFSFSENYKFNNSIVFLGGSAHTPNLDGVIWFLDNVWEKVLEINNELKFHIIGNWPNSIRNNFHKKYSNIEFKGFVPDLSDALKNSIMVVPLLDGSGMRMKIIEAAQMGCPIITTKVGVEGIDLINGESCLVEDESGRMAEKIALLSQDIIMQRMLREKAFKIIHKKYSKETLIDKRLNVYKEVLK